MRSTQQSNCKGIETVQKQSFHMPNNRRFNNKPFAQRCRHFWPVWFIPLLLLTGAIVTAVFLLTSTEVAIPCAVSVIFSSLSITVSVFLVDKCRQRRMRLRQPGEEGGFLVIEDVPFSRRDLTQTIRNVKSRIVELAAINLDLSHIALKANLLHSLLDQKFATVTNIKAETGLKIGAKMDLQKPESATATTESSSKILAKMDPSELTPCSMISVFDAIRNSKHILIEGDPGTGKSVLLHRLACAWANASRLVGGKELHDALATFDLVLLLHLGKVASDRWEEAVTAEYERCGSQLVDQIKMQTWNVLWLLDGYDEMSEKFREPWNNFIYQGKTGVTIVLATRHHLAEDILNDGLQKNFKWARIRCMGTTDNVDHIEEFLKTQNSKMALSDIKRIITCIGPLKTNPQCVLLAQSMDLQDTHSSIGLHRLVQQYVNKQDDRNIKFILDHFGKLPAEMPISERKAYRSSIVDKLENTLAYYAILKRSDLALTSLDDEGNEKQECFELLKDAFELNSAENAPVLTIRVPGCSTTQSKPVFTKYEAADIGYRYGVLEDLNPAQGGGIEFQHETFSNYYIAKFVVKCGLWQYVNTYVDNFLLHYFVLMEFNASATSKETRSRFWHRQRRLQDGNGYTVAHFASRYGFDDVLKIILENVEDCENFVNLKTDDGVTAAMCAARYDYDDCLKHLLNAKADIAATENQNETIVVYAVASSGVKCLKLIFNIEDDMVGKNINLSKGSDKTIAPTPTTTNASSQSTIDFKKMALRGLLTAASGHGNEDCVRLLIALINRFGGSINTPDEKGDTAFIYAARCGKLELMCLLQQMGADPNARNSFGANAAMFAACHAQVNCLELLLQVKHWATIDDVDNYERNLLHHAVIGGRMLGVKYLLERTKDLTARDLYGRNALHYAALYKHVEVLELLLDRYLTAGLDVKAVDDDGQNLLMQAAYGGSVPCVELIDKRIDFDANAGDKWGNTALMIAAYQGHIEFIEYLLKRHNVVVDQRNAKGSNALFIAAHASQVEAVRLLLQRSVNIQQDEKDHLRLHILAMKGVSADSIAELAMACNGNA